MDGSGRFLAADPGFLFADVVDWSSLQSLGHCVFFSAAGHSDLETDLSLVGSEDVLTSVRP